MHELLRGIQRNNFIHNHACVYLLLQMARIGCAISAGVASGSHLVEQWLKCMVIFAINDSHRNWCRTQNFCRPNSSEPTTNNYDFFILIQFVDISVEIAVTDLLSYSAQLLTCITRASL